MTGSVLTPPAAAVAGFAAGAGATPRSVLTPAAAADAAVFGEVGA